MCLIVFSYKQHSRYPFIFAANRDESYDRPSRPAQFWDDHPNILAGKDLQAGGTWMGINNRGEFAAITNYRDPSIQKDSAPSRGRLVLDFLKSDAPPSSFLSQLQTRSQEFMGFNLLAGSLDNLGYYSNQQDEILFLDKGLYGLSNHLLETPWPKVRRAKNKLQKVIKDDIISPTPLFDILADNRQAPEKQLPDTGIPKEIEKQVSPIFIQGENYGTRCSTVLLIDHRGTITFSERCFKAGTMEVEEENSYTFKLIP